ncbi:hypothetical protein [Okeania sp.]|uniref:hypothetical protein n=1 Tax=Okeania sp. TaxID=3100323 RepID=UPI002B4B58EB|nr:hypothetical protein [Okeania sp.]
MVYRTQAEDTKIEAELIFFNLISNLSIETRIMQAHRASIQSQQIWWNLCKQDNNITNTQLKRK